MIPTKLFIITAAAIIFSACNRNITQQITTHNSLTQKEKKAGWQLLFDGTTFNGWSKYGGAPIGKAWIIKDSSIYLDAAAKKSRLANT